jgi:hypothetical protein
MPLYLTEINIAPIKRFKSLQTDRRKPMPKIKAGTAGTLEFGKLPNLPFQCQLGILSSLLMPSGTNEQVVK